MKMFFLFLFLFLEASSTMIEATDRNFNELITANEVVVFMWYKPEDSKTEKALADFEKATEILKPEYSNIVFSKVNANEAKISVERIKIDKFPYFSMFIEGKTFSYDGGYLTDDFVDYVKNKLNPPIALFMKPEEADAFVMLKEVFLFIGETVDTNQQWQTFKRVVSSFDDAIFAACGSMDCILHYNIGYDNVLFIKDYANERKELINFENHSLRSFIRELKTPIFENFTNEAAKDIFKSYSSGIILYRDSDDDEQRRYDAIMKKTARYFKGAIHFVMTDVKGKIQEQLAFSVRIKHSDLPCVYIHDARLEDIKHYKLDKSITEENLNNFILDWIAGRLERYYKKEPVPEKQTSPVLKGVRDNYKELVLDSDTNVFVLFSAPGCPYCKPVEDDFAKLAQMLRKNKKDVTFVKINAFDNEIEGEVIESYPTIKLFRLGEKEKPMLFNWDKNMEKMLDFLKVYLNLKVELSMEDAVIDAEGIDLNDVRIEL
jgi:protein disulfide-isomerase A1